MTLKIEYKIKLETETDGIKDAKDLAPGPDLFRKEVASQKEAKKGGLQQQLFAEFLERSKEQQNGSGNGGTLPLGMLVRIFVLVLVFEFMIPTLFIIFSLTVS